MRRRIAWGDRKPKPDGNRNPMGCMAVSGAKVREGKTLRVLGFRADRALSVLRCIWFYFACLDLGSRPQTSSSGFLFVLVLLGVCAPPALLESTAGVYMEQLSAGVIRLGFI